MPASFVIELVANGQTGIAARQLEYEDQRSHASANRLTGISVDTGSKVISSPWVAFFIPPLSVLLQPFES
jgi:hypothetical protein